MARPVGEQRRRYTIKILIRPSLLGLGPSGVAGWATRVSLGPINSVSNFSCCWNDKIIAGPGPDFMAMAGEWSRIETFTATSNTQTAAKPAQIRRLGKNNSRQSTCQIIVAAVCDRRS